MAQFLACPEVHVKRCPARIPDHWFTTLEQNNKPDMKSCCRNPRQNATIQAWFSTPQAKEEGRVDIFIFRCTVCDCKHHRQMMGSGRVPVWQIA